MDLICDRTVDMHRRGLKKEILTVSSHVDGVYLYLKEKQKDPVKAQGILDLLKINGGNNSGIKIGCIDNLGNVHPDQFWWHYSLGNVTQRKFSDIWTDTSEPLLKGLRDRKPLLKGRCHDCKHLDICNGNLRVRAEAVYDRRLAEDPSCYLTNAEIGVWRLMPLDNWTAGCLNTIQTDFPLTPRPYAAIGSSLGISADEVIPRLQKLKAEHIIRMIGPVIDARRLGFESSLIAAEVGAECLDAAERSFPLIRGSVTVTKETINLICGLPWRFLRSGPSKRNWSN